MEPEVVYYVRESQVLNIDQKAFSLAHIRDLAAIIWDFYSKDELRPRSEVQKKIGASTPPLVSINFFIKSFDNSTFNSEHIAILDDDSVINKQRIKQVKVTYNSATVKNITLELNHGNPDEDDPNPSYVDVSGYESVWVKGVIGEFNSTLAAIPGQNNFLKKNKRAINYTFVILGTILFGFVIDLTNKGSEDFTPYWPSLFYDFNMEDLIGAVIVALLFGGLFGGFIAGKINSKVDIFWPSIELQVGPRHLQYEKKKRWLWGIIITLIIIPLIVSIVSAFITSALLGS